MTVHWTAEQIATAKRLYIEEGRSAAETARSIPGATRNAIIGKAHRMGWLTNTRQAPSKPQRIKAPSVPRSHVRPPKPGPQNKPAVILGAYSTSSPDQQAARAAEGRAINAAVKAGGGVASPNAKPWMERRFGECNWPLGERGEALSCCNPVHARGWCRGHYVLGTVPTLPMRQRAASSYARFDRVEKDRPMPANVDRTVWDDARSEAA